MTPFPYLIYCQYDYYQGIKSTWGYFLVYAGSYDDALHKLQTSKIVRNPRNFKNKTIL